MHTRTWVRWGSLCLFALHLILFACLESHARVVYLLDFDGTIVNDHGPQAAWRTPWILKRLDHIHTLIESNPQKLNLPEQIEVSFDEYRRLAPLLAKEEGLPGDFNPFLLDIEPLDPDRHRLILPGYYRVSPDITFTRYRPHPKALSYLLQDTKDAEKRTRLSQGELTWKGRAFPLLQQALSASDTVHNLVIHTARHHTDEEFSLWLAHLKKRRLIRHMESLSPSRRPRLISLNEPESLALGRSLSEKKGNVVVSVAQQMLISPEPTHIENGVSRHTLIVGEDDPRHVEMIRKNLEWLSSDHRFSHNIKFVFFHTGTDGEVRSARWPWRWTVFERGFGREANPSEVEFWTSGSPTPCETQMKGRDQ